MSGSAERVRELLSNNDMSALASILRQGREVGPRMRAAARPTGRVHETLPQKVEARCAFGQMGFLMTSITGGGFCAKGFAQQQTPPIVGGITWCVQEAKKIVIDQYARSSRSEQAQLPRLLRRIRTLLRVYFDFRLGQKVNPELALCDFKELFDVAIELHRVGLYLQLDPPRMRTIMAAGGADLEDFFLRDPLDVGPYRVAALRAEEAVEQEEEADDDDRIRASDLTEKAGEDLAAYTLCWLIADVNVALVINTPANDSEREWARLASRRLVRWSTNAAMRDALGDPLTDAMRPIYWSGPAVIQFSHAGGLGAVFGDWVNSSRAEACKETLTKLPDAAWDKQTKTSLAVITRELQNKILRESPQIVMEPIYVDACFNMWKRYGLAPFQHAANTEKWNTPIVFYYIQHRIKTDKLDMGTRADWVRLLTDYQNLPRTAERRYSWANNNISTKWDCLDFYGCHYNGCPEKEALLDLKSRRIRGVRDPEIEARLDRWGSKPKACGSCLHVAYCSPECQRADWPSHKAKCLEERKRRSTKKA